MQVAFILLCAISLLIVVVAVVILLGKGDDMIAGYNLASTKTRDRYHTPRVRIIVSVLLMLIALALPSIGVMLSLGYKELMMTLLPPFSFVLITGTFTTLYFWARKK